MRRLHVEGAGLLRPTMRDLMTAEAHAGTPAVAIDDVMATMRDGHHE